MYYITYPNHVQFSRMLLYVEEVRNLDVHLYYTGECAVIYLSCEMEEVVLKSPLSELY